ncbi:lysylphosphatidylglycerol synthase domain-containing protein [Candidatus Nitrotoga sp. M5]|uniref:lysylphosphatidylglycerol synthase domain-containing protein n=1 Tax=Candidatus Nitrotoga sp. M5 TaxID=2890409 RepID=UPI001EF201C2|nr:lysylphosphatidylglycerol synthase domain-containing protein [Candidatus Nitrotoga sp. M5]CAH1386796.1 PF03706 family inner membrane protein YbhN [Candidatus Nitrotoga sp. M5]
MARAEPATVPRSAGTTDPALAQHPWWPWVRRGLILIFFVAVAVLLVRFGREVEWDAVWKTVRANPPATLLLAAALAAVSHALVASFDLLGRSVTGHSLSAPRVLSVAWVSYVFNLNLGALVGGAGFRFRLYSRLGLDNGVIAHVYGLSVLTNWLGYLVLIGATFLLAPIALPPGWEFGSHGQTMAGVVLLLLALAYLLACGFAPGRSWQWHGHCFTLPTGRVAMVQLAMSLTNWAVITTILYILLGQKIDYPVVLGVMLMAAVAGAVTHVPAGLGVLEAVFVALLGDAMSQSSILAALLTYRALVYLAPLLLALAAYVVMEAGLRKNNPAPQRA